MHTLSGHSGISVKKGDTRKINMVWACTRRLLEHAHGIIMGRDGTTLAKRMTEYKVGRCG